MVPEIKKILFATDLSKNSRHAFNYAISAADKYGATITILHVMEEISPSANIHLKSFIGEESWQELQEKSYPNKKKKISLRPFQMPIMEEYLWFWVLGEIIQLRLLKKLRLRI